MPSCSTTTISNIVKDEIEEFSVSIMKGEHGIGIYFTEMYGSAIVDLDIPFYRLPSGDKAPGEDCGQITSGDKLIGINGESILSYEFKNIVDILRRSPQGILELSFQRSIQKPHRNLGFSNDNQENSLKMIHENSLKVIHENPLKMIHEKEIDSLRQELKTEKKCRHLLTKRVNLYREEIIRLYSENAKLRNHIEESALLKMEDAIIEV